MKNSIFWDITPCNPLKVNRSFRGKISACHLLSRWFLARLILRPWRWRRHVLRNVGRLSTDYTALYLRGQNSLQRRCHSVDPYCWPETKCRQEIIHNVQFLGFSTKNNLVSRIRERTCRPTPSLVTGPRRADAPSRYSHCNRQRSLRVRRSIPRTVCHLVICRAIQQRSMGIKLEQEQHRYGGLRWGEYLDTGEAKRSRRIMTITQ
jgi:hypothetical protein